MKEAYIIPSEFLTGTTNQSDVADVCRDPEKKFWIGRNSNYLK